MSRVAVVTGASAGIGRASAIRFAERGYDIGLIARGRAGLEGAQRDVEARGDVANPDVAFATKAGADSRTVVVDQADEVADRADFHLQVVCLR